MKPVIPEVPTGYARPIDLAMNVAMPGLLVCIDCGAAVLNADTHTAWHRWVNRRG